MDELSSSPDGVGAATACQYEDSQCLAPERQSRASDVMRKEHHLRASADFQRIRREGHTLLHPLMVISVHPNGLRHSRFGFAVGRRIDKAARRNRIKRRMREAVGARIRQGELATGWDVVLVARRPIRSASYREIDSAINQLLRRARLVSETP